MEHATRATALGLGLERREQLYVYTSHADASNSMCIASNSMCAGAGATRATLCVYITCRCVILAAAEASEEFDIDFDDEGELVAQGAPDGWEGGFYSTGDVEALDGWDGE